MICAFRDRFSGSFCFLPAHRLRYPCPPSCQRRGSSRAIFGTTLSVRLSAATKREPAMPAQPFAAIRPSPMGLSATTATRARTPTCARAERVWARSRRYAWPLTSATRPACVIPRQESALTRTRMTGQPAATETRVREPMSVRLGRALAGIQCRAQQAISATTSARATRRPGPVRTRQRATVRAATTATPVRRLIPARLAPAWAETQLYARRAISAARPACATPPRANAGVQSRPTAWLAATEPRPQ